MNMNIYITNRIRIKLSVWKTISISLVLANQDGINSRLGIFILQTELK